MASRLLDEPVVKILSSLDNARRIPPAFLSRSPYVSFSDIAASRISTNPIPSPLLPYAIATLTASQTHRPTAQGVENMLGSLNLRSKESASGIFAIDPTSALKIVQLHNVIHKLAIDFASTSLMNLHLPKTTYNKAPSSQEYNRICRALYRAELYFRLFRKPRERYDPILSCKERNQLFFDPYPPWVNEQLACIHDFLEQKVSNAAFREVAAHDVLFGELSIDYLSVGVENGWKQHFISQGLEFIDRLDSAANYNEKLELLTSKFDAESASLASALYEANHEQPDKTLAEYENEELERLQALGEQDSDVDSGPYDVWSWANQDELTAMFIYAWDKASLRKRGYVMWDHTRVAEESMINMFEKIMSMPQPSLEPTDEKWNEMQLSFKERSGIWQKGGRGFWSKEGESEIVWPESREIQNKDL